MKEATPVSLTHFMQHYSPTEINFWPKGGQTVQSCFQVDLISLFTYMKGNTRMKVELLLFLGKELSAQSKQVIEQNKYHMTTHQMNLFDKESRRSNRTGLSFFSNHTSLPLVTALSQFHDVPTNNVSLSIRSCILAAFHKHQNPCTAVLYSGTR